MDLTEDTREVEVASTLDGSAEKCLVFWPEGAEKAPLLVGLHSWSFDRFNQVEAMLPCCRERGWGLVLPEFRGPNLTSNPRAMEAGGSHLARQDIVDAVGWMVGNHEVDEDRVFLLGGSGGGHMALMMAAYVPERFFCEIFDGGHEIRYDAAFRWFDGMVGEREETRVTG